MTNILVRSFPSLENYGTGMMGLIAIKRLSALIPGPLTFHCDFTAKTDIAEIRSELGLVPGTAESERISLVRKVTQRHPKRGSLPDLASRAKRLVIGPTPATGMDLVLVLGGDDISEFYSKTAWSYMVAARRWAMSAPVVFLGHTIGPFALPRNRMAARTMLPQINIFPRDLWCTQYLSSEFGLGARLMQSSDLAYAPLPLQHRTDIADEVMQRFGLVPGGYATMVISGLQSQKYYTADRDLYLQRHAEIATAILNRPDMADRKLCLLAHTFGGYGHEPDYIEQMLPMLTAEIRARVVPVTARVLQTRARFILGGGLFTITGRMHPAVSTFQMGKPAITLAYSKKYEGVIGTMLGRSDLIIDANDSQLWESGEIVAKAMDRVEYAMANHERLASEIRTAIAAQQATIDATFARIISLLPAA